MKLIKSDERVTEYGEVFTPDETVKEMCSKIPLEIWKDKSYIFIEPTCGNGQFIVYIIEKRVKAGLSYEEAINTIIAMDIMEDNITDSLRRLYHIFPVKNRIRLMTIAINNIIKIDDSLEVLNTDWLTGFKFVYTDPTGDNSILGSKDRKQKERLAKEKSILFTSNILPLLED